MISVFIPDVAAATCGAATSDEFDWAIAIDAPGPAMPFDVGDEGVTASEVAIDEEFFEA